MDTWWLLVKLALSVWLILLAVQDWRTGRIPNWGTLPLLGVSVVWLIWRLFTQALPVEILWIVGLGVTLDEAKDGYTFTKSSHPKGNPLIKNTGPRYPNGPNDVPSYMLRVQTSWQMYLRATWDNCSIGPKDGWLPHEYKCKAAQVNGTPVRIPIDSPLISLRVWGSGENDGGTVWPTGGAPFCDARDGYVPIPVVEAQAVLVK